MNHSHHPKRGTAWKTVSLIALAAWALAAGPALAEDKVIVGLITKTNTNPFFAKMKEGAAAKAKELGVDFRSYAGKYDGDNTGQVDAIELLMEAGAKAILITPSDTKAIVPSIQRARKAGILVIALDTPLDPISAADATFATDNVKAGTVIGQWAAKTLGDKAKDAHVAFVDAIKDQPVVDRARDLGFQKGFGIETLTGNSTDTRATSVSPVISGARGLRKADERPWKPFSRRTRPSTSSIRSTNRRRPARTTR